MNEEINKDETMRVGTEVNKAMYYDLKRKLIGKMTYSEWVRKQMEAELLSDA